MFAAIMMGIMMNSMNVNDGLTVFNHEILSSSEIQVIENWMDQEEVNHIELESFDMTSDGYKFEAGASVRDGRAHVSYVVEYDDGFEVFGHTFFDSYKTMSVETSTCFMY